MSAKAPSYEIVEAVRVYEIYANFNFQGPNSEAIFHVTDKKIARGLCDLLTEIFHDRDISADEGWEHCDRFDFRIGLMALKDVNDHHFETLEEAVKAFCAEHEFDLSNMDQSKESH